MLHIDGVIFALQKSGGISVLFNEIISRLPKDCFSLDVPVLKRPWTRYIDAPMDDPSTIFHSTYYRLPSGRSRGVVTTVHDFTYEKFSRGPRSWIHSWQKQKAISGSDVVICVSESTRADLFEFSSIKDPSRVLVIPNGVSTSYSPLSLPIKSQVLFVGARGGYKNFINTIHALSGVADCRLVCVGGGGFTEAERILLDKLLPSRYEHAGFVTEEQLNRLYNVSICLVYPSLYEGFGIPVLEAMRSGCPVLAVDASSIPEVAGDAALLMECGSVDEIRAGIDFFQIEENRQLYREKGFYRSQMFSWDETFRRTRDVYEGISGKSL